MKVKGVILIVLVAILVALFTLKGLQTKDESENYTPPVSQSESAVRIEQAKQQGQPAWLLFHSTSWPSCIVMGQVFHTLEPEFKGEVVFVNIDVSDPAENKLSSQYQIQYIPTTYFLNHKGEITFSYVGVIQQDEMRAKLRALAEAE